MQKDVYVQVELINSGTRDAQYRKTDTLQEVRRVNASSWNDGESQSWGGRWICAQILGFSSGNLSVPMAHGTGCITPPARDSFGFYGNREGYKSTFCA
jgi:hypothetical protein